MSLLSHNANVHVRTRCLQTYRTTFTKFLNHFCFFSFFVIRPPGTVLCFTADVSFFHCEIFEFARLETLPSDRTCVQFYNPGPKIWEGGPPFPKKLGPKRAKLGSTSGNYKLRSRISPERMDMSKIGKLVAYVDSDSSAFGEIGPVNFGPLTTKLDM